MLRLPSAERAAPVHAGSALRLPLPRARFGPARRAWPAIAGVVLATSGVLAMSGALPTSGALPGGPGGPAGAARAAATPDATVTLAPGAPWPALQPGDVVVLAPGTYSGPWEIDVPDVRVDASGAVLLGPDDGSALVLSAPGIAVHGLEVRGGGSSTDLYASDAAAWLLGCDGCSLTDLCASGTPSGVRVEASRDVSLIRPVLSSGPGAPGINAYDAAGLRVRGARIDGFLDGVYLESSDDVVVEDSHIAHAFRYAFHAMFSRGTTLRSSTLTRNDVGSAAMYGRDVTVEENVFEGHVGPLGFGLLLQEVAEAAVRRNAFVGNTVGVLIVSVPDVTLQDNDVLDGGTGMLVRRTPTSGTSAVRAFANRFRGNVTDVAIDDPEAAVTLVGNAYETASRLDLDADGVSDVPHLPSSSFALLMSRQADLSLYALNPGVLLWETAEAAVPALRLATLQDPAPRLPRPVTRDRAADAPPGASAGPLQAAGGAWWAATLVLVAAASGLGVATRRTRLP